MSSYRALAPAKVNLGLFLGPTRASDGRHELVTVMQSISLADALTLEPSHGGAMDDELICAGVPGDAAENLAARALRAFRASTGWDAPPQRLRIVKRIPVAAGLAGGSADELAARLGADVPAQVRPGRWLASGAGERLQELPAPSGSLGLLVLPLDVELSTAAVYAEADRLGLPRDPEDLSERMHRLGRAMAAGEALPADGELLANDLQRAAISLCPPIASAIEQALQAGAARAFVSGSGPTVLGLYQDDGEGADGGVELAQRAAARLWGRSPAPIVARPVDAAFALAMPEEQA